jgi:hypothetical protein
MDFLTYIIESLVFDVPHKQTRKKSLTYRTYVQYIAP